MLTWAHGTAELELTAKFVTDWSGMERGQLIALHSKPQQSSRDDHEARVAEAVRFYVVGYSIKSAEVRSYSLICGCEGINEADESGTKPYPNATLSRHDERGALQHSRAHKKR
jgi:hypothetical protein